MDAAVGRLSIAISISPTENNFPMLLNLHLFTELFYKDSLPLQNDLQEFNKCILNKNSCLAEHSTICVISYAYLSSHPSILKVFPVFFFFFLRTLLTKTYQNVTGYKENTLCRKATVHQVTNILATSKNVLFPGHNHRC